MARSADRHICAPSHHWTHRQRCATLFVFANADRTMEVQRVLDTRYRLTDGPLLSRLMRCPDEGGTRHTVRSLADVSGVGKSKLSCMLRDRQMRVTSEQAVRIAEAVGVRRTALFTPIVSAFADTDDAGGNA